jgi:hypothetical protein
MGNSVGVSVEVNNKYNIVNQIIYVKDYFDCKTISELYKRLSWINKKKVVYINFGEDDKLIEDGIIYFLKNKNKYKFDEQIKILFILWYFKLFIDEIIYKTIIKCFSIYSLDFLTDTEFVNIILCNLELDYFILLYECVKDIEEIFEIMKCWGDFFIEYYNIIVCKYINFIYSYNTIENKEIFKEMIKYIYVINDDNIFKCKFIDILYYIKKNNFDEMLELLNTIDDKYFNNLICSPL